MKSLQKKHYAYLAAGMLMLAVAAFAYFLYSQISAPILKGKETHYVYIDNDDDMDSVRSKIETAGNASNMFGFTLTAKLKGFDTPKTGRFAITPGEDMFTFTRHMANGMQEPIRLTVPEVRTVEDMEERLSRLLMMSSDELAEVLNDTVFMKELGYTKENIPCVFIPNTYEVYWNITPQKLVEKLHKEKERFWNDERRAKAKDIGFTIEEVTTLASIVESETSYNPEKATIEALHNYAPLFRYATPNANLRFSMKKDGEHFYGHINEYLYYALPLIYKK